MTEEEISRKALKYFFLTHGIMLSGQITALIEDMSVYANISEEEIGDYMAEVLHELIDEIFKEPGYIVTDIDDGERPPEKRKGDHVYINWKTLIPSLYGIYFYLLTQ